MMFVSILIKKIQKSPLWVKSSVAGLAFIVVIIGAGLFADASLYDYTSPGEPAAGRGVPEGAYNSLMRYDSLHYKAIAEEGYTPVRTAFFPLYPILVTGLSIITGIGIATSLFATSSIFLLASVIVVAYWVRFELKERKSKLSPWIVLLLIGLFPTSFYLALGYSESLFIFTTVSALFAYRKKLYWLAAIAIVLATATRVQGGALAVFFLLDYLFARRWTDWKKLIPVAAAPFGLAAYMLYLGVTFGNPFEFIAAQQNWGRLNANIIENLQSSFRVQYLWYLPVLTLMLAAVWKYLGKTWFIYCLIFVLIPLSSGRLDSLNRYIVALPPLFLALALYLESKSERTKLLYITTSVFLLGWNILFFMNNYWVG